MITVAATLTVFNRRDSTLVCLRSLYKQTALATGVRLEVFLVDDGSTDGTAAAISSEFTDANLTIIESPGDLYWARGMALAQERCIASSHFDYMLWLNDDVELSPDALEVMLETMAPSSEPAICVGATEDEGLVTYTGVRRAGLRPTNLRPVLPDGTAQPVDAFNGNIVLVSRQAVSLLGTIDPIFEHAYGDNDYGLRAVKAGVPVFLAPTTLGRCPRNSPTGSWLDPSLGARRRSALLFSRRYFPVRSHFRFNVRHAGPIAGSMYALGQYAVMLGKIWFPRWRLSARAEKSRTEPTSDV